MLDKSPVARFNVSQVRAHEFLRTHPSLLAEGTYVPMPALTAEAAVVHAAVTLGRGKGTLARPVSPRTLSRSQGAAGGGNGGGNGLGGPGSPSSLVPPLLSHLTISRSAGRSMAPPPPPPMPMKVKSEDDDDDGCENKLPYSLFPVVEPMFPELMTLAPLPRAAKKSDSQRRTSEASQASWRRSSKSSIPGETGAARFLMKRFGRSSAKVAQK
ncbi:hypothetical protein BC828DRAFT_142947 [Blastocladiella britannica]|nr:hypothetical protein BC828DRAFT_142947 [Blastocladiella britannica]